MQQRNDIASTVPSLTALRHRAAVTAVAVAAFCSATAADAFNLTVEVANAKSAQGQIAAALYSAETGWMKDAQAVQALRVQAANGKTVLVFGNLPAGRYAVSLFHDENANQKMDTNVVGMPTEAYGFSRDAMGRMGPPSYADAAIELQGDTTITIQLR